MFKITLFALLMMLTLPALAAPPAPPARFQPLGTSAPSFRYQTIDGVEETLDPFYGQKVIILNFWATWCPPCVKEMPSLEKLATLLPASKYKVVTVAIQTEKAEVSGFFKRQGFKTLLPNIDPTMTSTRAFGLRGLPSTIIIDSNGKVLGRVDGELDWAAPEVVSWLQSVN